MGAQDAGQDGWDRWDQVVQTATWLPAAPAGPLAVGTAAGWWFLRVLLPVALVAALALEIAVLPDGPCTQAEPCLPAPWWNLVDGLHLGALAAVLLAPRAGLPLVALTVVPSLVAYGGELDEVGLVPVLTASSRLVAALAGCWWLWRERRAPLPSTPTARLPLRGRDVLASRGLGTLEAGAVVAVAACLALLGWFAWLEAGTDRHLARAEPSTVEVVRVDDVDWRLEVRVPGTSGTTELGVYDTDGYRVGDRVQALVDTTTDPAWVSLAQEPVEHDGWLVLAGLAGVVGAVAGADRVGALRARRRLVLEGGPVWRTTAASGAQGARVLLPELGLRAQLARALPPDELFEALGLLRHEVTADLIGAEPVDEVEERDEEERFRQEEFAAAWRGEHRADPAPGDRVPGGDDVDAEEDPAELWPVVLVGDPRPGGLVLAVTPDAVLLPFGRPVPMSPLERRDLRRAAADHTERVDDSGLPGVVAAPLAEGVHPRDHEGGEVQEVVLRLPRWRLLGASALLLLPLAFWLTADGSLPPAERLTWFQSVTVLFGAGSLTAAGLGLARTSVRLRPDGLHLRGRGLVTVHPWAATAGVRVVEGAVVVALGVDEDGDVDATGGPPLGMDALTAAGLAERWRRAGTVTDRSGAVDPRRTVDPVVGGVVLLYALAAASSLVWPLLPWTA